MNAITTRTEEKVPCLEAYHENDTNDPEAKLMPEQGFVTKSDDGNVFGRWMNLRNLQRVPKKVLHVRTISVVKRRRRKHLALAAGVGLIWSVRHVFMAYLNQKRSSTADFRSTIITIIVVTTHVLRPKPARTLDEILWHWGFPSTRAAALSKASLNSTLNIEPEGIHSHNDYWRQHPLFDAIEYGAESVEADVWLQNVTENGVRKHDLLVGHKRRKLKTDRTLRSLYLDPLAQIIERQNSPETMRSRKIVGSSGFQGIYDASPDTSLGLLIDVKTNGTITLSAVLEQLQPLRDKNWLTYFNHTSQEVVKRPLTVIMSGNSVFKDVVALPANVTTMPFRDVFFDAPLDKLGDSDKGQPIGQFLYNTTNSHYASVAFGKSIGKFGAGGLTSSQSAKVKDQTDAARARGLLSRYYDTPNWPSGKRELVWRDLVNAGVGILSVDNLKSAQKFFKAREKGQNH